MCTYSFIKNKIIWFFDSRKALLFFFGLGALLILWHPAPVVANNTNSDQRYVKNLSVSKQNAKLVYNESLIKQSNNLPVVTHGCNIASIQKKQIKYNKPVNPDWRDQTNTTRIKVLNSAISKKTVKQLTFKVKTVSQHDKNAFTQGLVYYEDALYESIGGLGSSRLRKLDVKTGEVTQVKEMPAFYFAEGLTVINRQLVQLTLKKNVAQVYDINSFKLIDQFSFKGDGWGLAELNGRLIISDGSSVLKIISGDDYSLIEEVQVIVNGVPLTGINEMEIVEGWLFANVLPTNCVAIINPASYTVVGWLNLSALYPEKQRSNVFSVLNGLAYDATKKILLVTGKYWPKIYHLTINNLMANPE